MLSVHLQGTELDLIPLTSPPRTESLQVRVDFVVSKLPDTSVKSNPFGHGDVVFPEHLRYTVHTKPTRATVTAPHDYSGPIVMLENLLKRG